MTESQPLIIKRIFDAPRELVYAAWTQNEHMKVWSCPESFVIAFGDLDVRPGGKWHAGMKGPDGIELKLGGEYLEVIPNEHLKYTHAWEEADGTPGTQMLVTVDFDDVDGKTEMTFTQTGFDSIESRDGHEGGWSQSFDKLTAYLIEKR